MVNECLKWMFQSFLCSIVWFDSSSLIFSVIIFYVDITVLLAVPSTLFLSLSLGDAQESSDLGLAAAAPDVQAMVESSSAQEEQLSQVVSGLRLENQLLRNEVSSLNQEMATLVQRAKDTQEGARPYTYPQYDYKNATKEKNNNDN